MLPLQIKELDFEATKAYGLSSEKRKVLKEKLRSLGHPGLETLQLLEKWIADTAPIFIHINFEKPVNGKILIDLLLTDTHYRNQFETHITGGSNHLVSRKSWETRMFGSCYDNQDTYRPKYACLNLSSDGNGFAKAAWYGSSFFVLNNNARWRCTVTSRDSSDKKAMAGTLRHCNHILFELDDDELEMSIQAAKQGHYMPETSFLFKHYKEIQIHGPVEFKRDIAGIFVDSNLSDKCKNKVQQFANLHGLPIMWLSKERMAQRSKGDPSNVPPNMSWG